VKGRRGREGSGRERRGGEVEKRGREGDKFWSFTFLTKVTPLGARCSSKIIKNSSQIFC